MTFAVITGLPAVAIFLVLGASFVLGLVWHADRFGSNS